MFKLFLLSDGSLNIVIVTIIFAPPNTISLDFTEKIGIFYPLSIKGNHILNYFWFFIGLSLVFLFQILIFSFTKLVFRWFFIGLLK